MTAATGAPGGIDRPALAGRAARRRRRLAWTLAALLLAGLLAGLMTGSHGLSLRDFTTELDNPNVIGRASAGVDLYATDRVELRLQYDGSFADGQTSNGGQFRLSYFF